MAIRTNLQIDKDIKLVKSILKTILDEAKYTGKINMDTAKELYNKLS